MGLNKNIYSLFLKKTSIDIANPARKRPLIRPRTASDDPHTAYRAKCIIHTLAILFFNVGSHGGQKCSPKIAETYYGDIRAGNNVRSGKSGE